MKKYWFYILLVVLSTAWACDGIESSQGGDSNLPRASTVPNEILVVMDSAKWQGAIGEELRDIFAAPIPGLPQEEPAFNVRYVSPRHFKGFMKLYPNIVFVTTLDDGSPDSRVMRTYFTENSLQQMRQNPDMFMYPLSNEFARGQEVMHLFAQTEEGLLQKLEENESRLRNYFLEFERNRLSRKFFTGLPQKELSQYVERKHGFRMEFPVGYKVAIEDDNFIWIRLLDQSEDRSVWVGYKDYDDEEVFTKENILDLRLQFARQYIFGSDSTTYMRTERDAPVHTRELNFKGRYAVETRGLWRLNNVVMGGPFVSYTFVDEPTNRLYYIEGFVYAPGQDKRPLIREVEAILHTFKTSSQQQAAATEQKAAAETAAN